MTDSTPHAREIDLHELLDGRLEPARRAAIESHVAGCASCRRSLDALRDARTALARMPPLDLPSVLTERVREALDHEAPRRGGVRLLGVRLAPALAWSILAAVLVGLVMYRFLPRDDVSALAGEFDDLRREPVSLTRITSDPAELERYFGERRLGFDARVFDFGMMGLRLIGGDVREIAGRRTAVFVYRAADGSVVVCQMYEGRVPAAAGAEVRRRKDDLEFLVFDRDRRTVVVWQEGNIVCALVADGDRETTVQLAFAKGQKMDGGTW